MPAYNFKRAFAKAVETGEKRQTIRKRRKRPTRVGDMLYLYTGQRTKACRRLAITECTGVYRIRIESEEVVYLNNIILVPCELEALAQDDGFESIGEFVGFFRDHYGLPFEGVLVRWR